MSEPKHRFNLIMPLRLWERIKDLASRNRRPITQEIILAIENRLDKSEEDTTSAVEKGNSQ